MSQLFHQSFFKHGEKVKDKHKITLGLTLTGKDLNKFCQVKLRCEERFTHAFNACGCVFKEITLVGSNHDNCFENATACSKRTLKTTVATQLYS